MAENNTSLEDMIALSTGRMQEAVREFPDSTYILTGAGVDAAMMLNLATEADIDLNIIHLRSIYQPKQTPLFLRELEELFDFEATVYGFNRREVAATRIKNLLFPFSKDRPMPPSKEELMHQAIGDLGVGALMSGVRGDQTKNRSALQLRQAGSSGEERIHPILDWTQSHVDAYFEQKLLPRHPLWPTYTSVDHKHHMVRGDGRGNVQKTECGLHGPSDRQLDSYLKRFFAIMTSNKEQS